MTGDFQKISEMKRKNAEEQGRTIPENIFQDIQEMKKLQKPDDATFCNLFKRKMTYFFAFVGRLQMYEKL